MGLRSPLLSVNRNSSQIKVLLMSLGVVHLVARLGGWSGVVGMAAIVTRGECIPQCVLSVASKRKCHSSLAKAGRCTVAIATARLDQVTGDSLIMISNLNRGPGLIPAPCVFQRDNL